MKSKQEVLKTLLNLSEKMLSDKVDIEENAKSLGYSINLDSEFNRFFFKEVIRLYPVVNYMYNENSYDKSLYIDKVTNVSEKMLFAICNPEIYMVNRFYNVIEKFDDKKCTLKLERCSEYLNELMKCFNISCLDIKQQANGKSVFYFDNDNYNKLKSVIMYSNVYTENLLPRVNDDICKKAAKENRAYYDILAIFMADEDIEKVYPYINKYLLKETLKS